MPTKIQKIVRCIDDLQEALELSIWRHGDLSASQDVYQLIESHQLDKMPRSIINDKLRLKLELLAETLGDYLENNPDLEEVATFRDLVEELLPTTTTLI